DVHITHLESEIYASTVELVAKLQQRRSGSPPGLAVVMPARQASSCLPVMRDYIKDLAIKSEAETDAREGLEEDPGRFGDTTYGAVEFESSLLDEIDQIEALCAQLGDADSKYDAFRTALESFFAEGNSKILAFSFFRRTLRYLAGRLTEDGIRCKVMDGSVKPADRSVIIDNFRKDDVQVLLCSQIRSEGLDFEFCSVVINYDLPWNPMEVEQRIGRIDRFGQEEDVVYVVNLHTPGTIEADIIARVHQRIGVFNDSIGELEPIIGQFRNDLNAVIYDFALTPEQRQEQIERILTAVETKSAIIRELEDEQGLRVLDDAEIDGFEDEVVRTGRYVGQPELVWLLEDWASFSAGARCEVSDDGYWLYFRGTADLAEHLYAVQAAGERSASEIADLAARLRDETEIILCLDQETARKRGADLLNTTHPLVRAALQVPGVSQCRYGSARIRSRDLDPGTYTILVGVARWNGVRPASEFWTSAVDAAGEPLGNGPGDALLAVLAAAGLEMTDGPAPATDGALADCQRQLDRWLDDETERRVAENRTLAEARRLSLRESHDRKIAQIRQGIATLQESGNPGMIPLFESRIRAQEHRLGRDEQALEEASKGSMDLEYVAVCLLEVVHA
ncbi:MAG TPA: hypothetical protein DGN59_05210, partial [Candidatus Latescibacteria bacterium]|nr:hypothetical protein [Candidatus Latescibacterota bacterium]